MRSALVLTFVGILIFAAVPAAAQQPSHKPGGFHSPEIHKDQSWSHVFNATGVSSYHCHPHPFMTGQIEVKAGAPNGPITIAIQGFKFVPDAITVGVGTNVTWTNRDPSFHTVDESAEAPSSDVKGGKTPAVSAVMVLAALVVAAVWSFKDRR